MCFVCSDKHEGSKTSQRSSGKSRHLPREPLGRRPGHREIHGHLRRLPRRLGRCGGHVPRYPRRCRGDAPLDRQFSFRYAHGCPCLDTKRLTYIPASAWKSLFGQQDYGKSIEDKVIKQGIDARVTQLENAVGDALHIRVFGMDRKMTGIGREVSTVRSLVEMIAYQNVLAAPALRKPSSPTSNTTAALLCSGPC
jgi:hypothetical protein